MNTRTPARAPKGLARAAVHEAAHAVVAHSYGMTVHEVVFHLNEDRSWSAFVAICPASGHGTSHRKEFLCLDMAGAAGEFLALHDIGPGCNCDLATAVENAKVLVRSPRNLYFPSVPQSKWRIRFDPIPCQARVKRLLASAFEVSLRVLKAERPTLLGLADFFSAHVRESCLPNVVFPGGLVTEVIENGGCCEH